MGTDINLEGSMVALVTPFSGGEVDWDALARLIELQIEGGTQGLVPCGTTGESPTLSHDEHDKVIEFTVAKAAGRLPVVAGTGSNATAEAVRLTQHAKDAGADACLVVNPYYNKPTQQGMYDHIARLAEIGLPIVLYNIPSRTGIELAAETVVRMYEEIEMVVAVKEATGKLDMVPAAPESLRPVQGHVRRDEPHPDQGGAVHGRHDPERAAPAAGAPEPPAPRPAGGHAQALRRGRYPVASPATPRYTATSEATIRVGV